ncbi:asparagine synthase (glutamine-hydrolyzing) [Baekduia sp. Peel2402]|uniref:asparagine synthase (glutamine-hydrolyzing) n=1 Tax=Baekduia sp. Peel2402 TaxID=3458296 RepID=UPI00403E409A
MCGIVGQLRPAGLPVQADLIERMCAGLEHRGPDSRGIHRDARVGLGIQRLRVIDLGTGDQPIYNEDRSIVVVMNGEIYNYRELREDLMSRGHTLATKGDTEVIVHLYEEHGADCVKHLKGMFAFALWDMKRQQLLLARDRIGKKPLLYARRPDGTISWASEMQALLADTEIRREVDPVAIDRFLALGYVPTPMSAIRGVRKLPPAHTMLVREGAEPELKCYWSLDYSTKLDASVPELVEMVREGLRAATRRRMVSDVPLGAFLSGGIDSSAVVAAMAEASSEPVRTFSIGFDHEHFDELPHARRIAQQFGTVHEEFQVRADAVSVLPTLARHYGEPFADASAIPSFYLAEMAGRHVTVALNGDGGDESFGGYTRYVANALASRLDRIPAPLRHMVAAVGARVPEGGAVGSPRNRFRRLAGSLALDGPTRYARYQSWIDTAQRDALYASGFASVLAESEIPDPIGDAWRAASGSAAVDKMLEVDVRTYLLDDLIAKVDIATMAHALEARSPLLDPELMQLGASIPAHYKVRGQEKKWILREALRGWLPDDLLDRPKQGFSVPLSDWLRGDLRDYAHEVLLDRETLDRGYFDRAEVTGLLDRHAAGTDGEAKRIWALLTLELWHREIVDAPAIEPPAEALSAPAR